MADEKPESSEATEGESDEKKGGILALLMKTPVLVGGLMTVEAVVLFVVIKMFSGSPEAALADEVHLEGEEQTTEYDEHGHPIEKAQIGEDVLLDVAEIRAHNTRSGKHYLFDVTFYAVVSAEQAEDAQAKIDTYKPLIQDRARTIIGGIDPDKLSANEPGLETLRRKMMHELEQVVGQDVVKEVVVPRCVPFRIDY